MTLSLNKFTAGILTGFFAAVAVDLHGLATNPGPFNWELALQRWIIGAALGAIAGLGIPA